MTATGLGFAGAGGLGEAMIRAVAQAPGLRVAAVQDVDAARAAEVAERYASPWRGTDYDALLAAPGVDAVVLCTPNALHVPQARKALQRGKHVLVQKPLALSPADAAAIVEDARASGRVLFVDYTYRCLDTTRLLAERLADIGRVQRVQAVFHNIYGPGKPWFFDPALSGGGALTDLGVHLLDLAIALCRPRSVNLAAASLSYRLGYTVEDAATLALALDGLPFSVDVSWNAELPQTEIALGLTGNAGTLRWENVDGSFFRFRTLLNGNCLLDRETGLREDTLAAFAAALAAHTTPNVDLQVYELLAEAYTAGKRSRAAG